MEPSGRNTWQSLADGTASKTAQTSETVAALYCCPHVERADTFRTHFWLRATHGDASRRFATRSCRREGARRSTKRLLKDYERCLEGRESDPLSLERVSLVSSTLAERLAECDQRLPRRMPAVIATPRRPKGARRRRARPSGSYSPATRSRT